MGALLCYQSFPIIHLLISLPISCHQGLPIGRTIQPNPLVAVPALIVPQSFPLRPHPPALGIVTCCLYSLASSLSVPRRCLLIVVSTSQRPLFVVVFDVFIVLSSQSPLPPSAMGCCHSSPSTPSPHWFPPHVI